MKKRAKYALFFLFLFSSCDFTPTINKEILEAQEFLLIQQYKKSISMYNQILERNLDKKLKVKIYYQLGEIYSTNLGLNLEAIENFEKVKDLTEDPLFLVKSEEKIADISYSFLKDYKKSYESYNNLAEFSPRLKEVDDYEYRRALSSFKAFRLDQSSKDFEKIQNNKLHKYQSISFYYLGLINFHKKNWSQSLAYLQEYTKREDKKESVIEAKFLMANIYESTEKLKKAYDLYYSILGKYPNTEVVQNRLNSIYSRRIARKR